MKALLDVFEVIGLILAGIGVVGEARLRLAETRLRQAIKWKSGFSVIRRLSDFFALILGKDIISLGEQFHLTPLEHTMNITSGDWISRRFILMATLTNLLTIIVAMKYWIAPQVNSFIVTKQSEATAIALSCAIGTALIVALVLLLYRIYHNPNSPLPFRYLIGAVYTLSLSFFLILYLLPYYLITLLLLGLTKLILTFAWGGVWLSLRPYAVVDWGVQRWQLQSALVIIGVLIGVVAVLLKP